MPDPVLDFCIEVAKNAGLEVEFLAGRSVDADVLSYAIEAAQALRL